MESTAATEGFNHDGGRKQGKDFLLSDFI